MNNKKQNLFVNAIVLTFTALIMRTIGIMYKVYISNNIGAEGMGIYKLISTVYMLAITFAISGISTAITRIISEEVGARAYNNIKLILVKSLVIVGILSVVVCTTTLIFSRYIAEVLLRDERALLAIRIVAFSIPFVAISSCIKGYFYAIRDIFVPITSQIVEMMIKITVVVALLNLVLPLGIEYGCAVLVLGTTVSEIVSCIYVGITYALERREKQNLYGGKADFVTKRLFNIALPIATSSYVRAGFNTVETMLIPFCLIKFGMPTKEAMSVLGGVMGMIFPVIMFPAALLMSMGTIIMPEISRAKAGENNERVLSLINRAIGFTILIGILVFFILRFFGKELGIAIYNNDNIGRLFTIFAFIVPIMYLDMLMDGILKGLNQQVKALEYDIFESILRIGLIYLLLPIKGLDGFIITLFISEIVSFILGFSRIIKVTRIKIDIINWIMKPLLLGGIAATIGKLLWLNIRNSSITGAVEITVVIMTIIVVYFVGLVLIKGIKLKDN